MKYLMVIRGEKSPEMLERLLRVCRHRGFNVQNINAESIDNEQSLHITLTVSSERPISQLSKQLDKIFGITQVAVIGQEQMIKAS